MAVDQGEAGECKGQRREREKCGGMEGRGSGACESTPGRPGRCFEAGWIGERGGWLTDCVDDVPRWRMTKIRTESAEDRRNDLEANRGAPMADRG